MITLLATAAVLSCNEAQRLVNRVSPELFTRREYKDIVRVIKDSAPKRCKITDNRHRTTRRYQHRYPIVQRHTGTSGYRPQLASSVHCLLWT